MKNNKELFLILTKEWFLKILRGEIKEEYRDFTHHYIKKLCITDSKSELIDVQKYEIIRYQLGYSKVQMLVECKGILVEADNEEDEEFTTDNCNFVIELGEILEKINCESLNV